MAKLGNEWVYAVIAKDIRPDGTVEYGFSVGATDARSARRMVERHGAKLLARRGIPVLGVLVTTGARRVAPYTS